MAAAIPLCGLLILGVIGFPKDTPWVLAVAPAPKAKGHRQKIKFTPKELAFIQSAHDHPPLMSAMNPLPGEAAAPERATHGVAPPAVAYPSLVTRDHFEPLWPDVAEAYAGFEVNVGLHFAPLTNAKSPPYDQSDFSFVLWAAFFLGAPGVFGWAAIRDRATTEAQMAEGRKAEQDAHAQELMEIRRQHHSALYDLQKELEKKNEALAKLQASHEFLTQQNDPGVPESLGAPKPVSGVMDTDVL